MLRLPSETIGDYLVLLRKLRVFGFRVFTEMFIFVNTGSLVPASPEILRSLFNNLSVNSRASLIFTLLGIHWSWISLRSSSETLSSSFIFASPDSHRLAIACACVVVSFDSALHDEADLWSTSCAWSVPELRGFSPFAFDGRLRFYELRLLRRLHRHRQLCRLLNCWRRFLWVKRKIN